MSNDVWHIALEPGTTNLQDIIVAKIDISDIETISYLLSTNQLKSRSYETNWGGFLMMYGGEYERPFPSVMIWRFENRNGENIVKDMRQEDAWIVQEVWKEMLMPEPNSSPA